jgi:hypothetical protein
MAHLTIATHTERARAELPTDEELEKAVDKLATPLNRPASGRNTALGRRVEKPAKEKQGGPSGQTDECQHDRKHTNK